MATQLGSGASATITRGCRVGDDVRDLAVAIEDVDRCEDGAETDGREEQIDELQAIGEVHGDTVASSDPRPASARAMRFARASISPNVNVVTPPPPSTSSADSLALAASERSKRSVNCMAPNRTRKNEVGSVFFCHNRWP